MLHVRGRQPGRAQPHVNFGGGQIRWLHRFQRLDIFTEAGIGDAGGIGGDKPGAKNFKYFIEETKSFGFNRIVPTDELCNQKTITNLRLRLLSDTKLVILAHWTHSRHAHIGRARKRSSEGIPVPVSGRE
jgi:hypothetical protein